MNGSAQQSQLFVCGSHGHYASVYVAQPDDGTVRVYLTDKEGKPENADDIGARMTKLEDGVDIAWNRNSCVLDRAHRYLLRVGEDRLFAYGGNEGLTVY